MNYNNNFGRKGIKEKQRALNQKGVKLKKSIGLLLVDAIIICILSGGVLGICLGIGVFNGIIASAPNISAIDVTPSGYATTVYDSEGHAMARLVGANSNRTYVSMDKIPQNLCDAFVAIEDNRFYQHNGIDIIGIIRAGKVTLTTGDMSQGASTITQQLIKNTMFTQWATAEGETMFGKVKRKIQEQYLAIELEKTLSKTEILELYLNTINLGQNTLGVQAASMRYFGKSVYDLNLSECAVIAAITQNPSKWNPISHPDNNAKRRKKVLDDMLEYGFITQAEHDEAMADDVYSRIKNYNENNTESSVYSYFVDEVIEQAMADLTEYYVLEGYTETQASAKAANMIYSGGLSIYTTQEPQIQSIADEVCSDPETYPEDVKWLLSYQLTIQKADGSLQNISSENYKSYYKEIYPEFNMLYNTEEDAYAAIADYQAATFEEGDEVYAENITLTPQPQISLCIMDQSTGYVLALVGGRGQKLTSRSLNRATNTTRQPGSCFKVLAAFAPAIDTGTLTLASVYEDAPYNYSNGRPIKNWYGANTYWGIQSIRRGVEQSLNIIAVKTITQITPQVGFNYIKNFGFSTVVDRRVESNGMVTTDITQSLALGGLTDGVTNMDLTAAYACLANGGIYNEPILYTKIVDHDGNTLIDKVSDQTTRRVVQDTTAFLMTSAMIDCVTKGTGTAVNFGTQRIAGKTGTTSDNYDVWFAGYTPYYTCTTWTGYDNNVTMNTAEKAIVKTIWRNVMSQIHDGLEYRDFNMPGNIVTATVCSQSGKLPVEGLCDDCLKTEYFAEGTVPTTYCDVHYVGEVCAYSGKVACENCPFKVQGVVELPLVEDPAVQKGSPNANTTNYCEHDALFYTDPGYRSVLEAENAVLTSMGFNFSLEGY